VVSFSAADVNCQLPYWWDRFAASKRVIIFQLRRGLEERKGNGSSHIARISLSAVDGLDDREINVST